MKAILSWFIQLVKHIAERSWQNSKKVHKKALRKTEGWIRLLIALFLLAIFSIALIPDETKIGLSFLFAGLTAVYAGYIYKGMHVMGYVLGGAILASVIPSLFPSVSESYKNADYIGCIILVLLGLIIWYCSAQLKKGERPTLEERKAVKHRRSKR